MCLVLRLTCTRPFQSSNAHPDPESMGLISAQILDMRADVGGHDAAGGVPRTAAGGAASAMEDVAAEHCAAVAQPRIAARADGSPACL